MNYPADGTQASVYSGADNRLLNRNYLPASIRDAALRPVKVAATTTTASVTLPNNSMTTFQFAASTKNHNQVMAAPNISLYAGGLDPVVNLLPGGTGVPGTQYVMWGPIDVSYTFAGASLTTAVIQSRLGVSNTSGSSQLITLVVTYRYIANGGDIIP